MLGPMTLGPRGRRCRVEGSILTHLSLVRQALLLMLIHGNFLQFVYRLAKCIRNTVGADVLIGTQPGVPHYAIESCATGWVGDQHHAQQVASFLVNIIWE